jgi:hypothetical protein
MLENNMTEKQRQWNAVRHPDDGRKDARNMLRNNWLVINHYLLHLVGLTFIYLFKSSGISKEKFRTRQSPWPVDWRMYKRGDTLWIKQTMYVQCKAVTCSYDYQYNGKETMRIVEPHNTDSKHIECSTKTHLWRINVAGSDKTYLGLRLQWKVVLPDFNQIWIFSPFSCKSPISFFTKIRPVGVALKHADRPMDGQTWSSQALFEICKRIPRKPKASST